MFAQIPVYLGENCDNWVATAEILDNKVITITIRSEMIVDNLKNLIDLSQIQGLNLSIIYLPAVEYVPADAVKEPDSGVG